MLSTIAGYLTGRAAKAGLAWFIGTLGTPGAIVATEHVTGGDLGLTILGYVVIGALGGLINWAGVYFKKNDGAVNGVFPPRPGGLY